MTLTEIRKIVSTDPETRNLNIGDVDLLKVYQYLSARDEPETDGYQAVLLTEPYIEVVYRPTKERSDAIKRARIRENLRFYDTEVYIQNASIEDFECFNEERTRLKDLAVRFLKEYRPDRFSQGLYIYGRYATGKSYLISAVAQELARRNVSVLFCYMPDLVRSIKQGMNEGNLEERVNQLKGRRPHARRHRRVRTCRPGFAMRFCGARHAVSARPHCRYSRRTADFSKLVEAMTAIRDESNHVKAARLVQRSWLMTYAKLTFGRIPRFGLEINETRDIIRAVTMMRTTLCSKTSDAGWCKLRQDGVTSFE